ncbi:MAG: type II toxin-antitoxin system HicA family toxin [Paracoccaceae bacterium]
MDNVVYIGGPRDAEVFRNAGILSYAPPLGLLAERVIAERRRCNVLAMTESTFASLPAPLARELREGGGGQVTIVPHLEGDIDDAQVRRILRDSLGDTGAAWG